MNSWSFPTSSELHYLNLLRENCFLKEIVTHCVTDKYLTFYFHNFVIVQGFRNHSKQTYIFILDLNRSSIDLNNSLNLSYISEN